MPEWLCRAFHDENDKNYQRLWQRPLKALQHEMQKCAELHELLMMRGGAGCMLEVMPQEVHHEMWALIEAMWKQGMMNGSQ